MCLNARYVQRNHIKNPQSMTFSTKLIKKMYHTLTHEKSEEKTSIFKYVLKINIKTVFQCAQYANNATSQNSL